MRGYILTYISLRIVHKWGLFNLFPKRNDDAKFQDLNRFSDPCSLIAPSFPFAYFTTEKGVLINSLQRD